MSMSTASAHVCTIVRGENADRHVRATA